MWDWLFLGFRGRLVFEVGWGDVGVRGDLIVWVFVEDFVFEFWEGELVGGYLDEEVLGVLIGFCVRGDVMMEEFVCWRIKEEFYLRFRIRSN